MVVCVKWVIAYVAEVATLCDSKFSRLILSHHGSSSHSAPPPHSVGYDIDAFVSHTFKSVKALIYKY